MVGRNISSRDTMKVLLNEMLQLSLGHFEFFVLTVQCAEKEIVV